MRIVFRTDTTWVAEILKQKQVRVSEYDGNKQVASFPNDDLEQIDLLAASTDGIWLAGGSGGDKTLRLWNLDRLEASQDLPLKGFERMTAGSFSSDNRYLALTGCTLLGEQEACLRSKAVVYDLETGEMIEELSGQQIITLSMLFLPDTHLLVMAGSGEKLGNADLLVWDVDRRERQAKFACEEDVECGFGKLVASRDGKILATGRGDGVTFFSTHNWEQLDRVKTEGVYGMAFVPNTYLVVLGEYHSELVVIDGTPPEPHSISGEMDKWGSARGIETDRQYIANIFVSPDGRFLYIHDSERGLVEKWGIPVMVTATPAP